MSWSSLVTYFSPERDPRLRDPDGTRIDVGLMLMLDAARSDAGVAHIITSGARTPEQNAAAGGAEDSAHLPDLGGNDKVLAVDLYVEGWSVWKQFMHFSRYPWLGIGLYPYPLPGRARGRVWTPVVHLDLKRRGLPMGSRLLWVRDSIGAYRYWPSAECESEMLLIASKAG